MVTAKKFKLTKKAKYCILAIIAITMFCLFLFLFTAQINEPGNRYPSDINAHIDISINGKGYSVLFRSIDLLYDLTGTRKVVAPLVSLMMVVTWFATAKLMKAINNKLGFFSSALLALPAMFVTGIFLPGIHGYFYRHQIVTQPYHNITYIGMRMFAVLAMLVFNKVFENYLKKTEWYHWLLLTLLLALSTAIKPSFFYGFALTLFFFLLVAFFQNKCRLKPFFKMFVLGSVVFLSLYVMFGQANVLYADKPGVESSGIAFILGKRFIKHGFIDTSFKLICGLSFPVLVGITNRKKICKTEGFIYAMYAVQLAVTILLSETGKRAGDGNFYWGLYCGGFFLFLVTFSRFWSNLKERENYSKYYIYAGVVLMALHIICSICYCSNVVFGYNYYK